jgi:hypothetical protein
MARARAGSRVEDARRQQRRQADPRQRRVAVLGKAERERNAREDG